jgi:hypothetical protein
MSSARFDLPFQPDGMATDGRADSGLSREPENVDKVVLIPDKKVGARASAALEAMI